MTHEFSHHPIKVRVVDIKTGEWKKSYIFIGNVPPKVERDLLKLEKLYNTNNKIMSSSVLKTFYGKNWQYRLGVDGTKQTYGGSDSQLSDETKELINSMDIEDEQPSDRPIIGGTVFDLPDADDLAEFDIGDELLEANTTQNETIGITDTEMQEIISEDVIAPVATLDFTTPLTSSKLEINGNIKFIFNLKIYPSDNILTFKQKIYLQTGIPIYRQHVWFKYKNRSYPAHYILQMFDNSTSVNIESLIGFYNNRDKMDEIEGIPVNLSYYTNKDFMRIQSHDTFNLMYTNYDNYGTTEYFVVDANDLLNPTALYNKLKRDRYQLEVIHYGFIAIYFPIMTFPVFMDYLKNENDIEDIYEELKYDKLYLRKRFEAASRIIDESYTARENSKEIRKKLFSSITSTTVSINNYKQDIDSLLVLRNIFDLLVLNSTITYCKAHLLHKNKKILLKKSYFSEPEPRYTMPLNSLLIKIKLSPDTNEYMNLILFESGNYLVKTHWREELHMDFSKITKDVSFRINPIINTINKMRDKIRYYNVDIQELHKDNVRFTETNFVFYYEDDVTEARFNVFKKILHDMSVANIIIPKENIILAHEYFFQEGMYKFDATRIEKVINVCNYYEHLSNGTVSQKWNSIFKKTQSFSVLSASSKLKITINGIRNDTEMHFFYLYLFGMLSIYTRNASTVKRIVGESIQNKSKKLLKNLKMQDPILYDFKKIYDSKVIYSKICQKPYQPIILSNTEYKNLSQSKKEKVVKYWNFTKDKPALYSCPNPKFPYIKFIIKQHPKDYCIPCCKKIEMNDNVHAEKKLIHETCMSLHKFTGEKVSLTKGSQYIATYGKDIEVGRLSRLPEHTLEPLFFDTYSPDSDIDSECLSADGYYLFGVDQNTSNARNIGYLYCLTHSLNMSVDDFIQSCTKKIRSDPIKFRAILNGGIGMYFGNNDEFADKISLLNTDTFLENRYENVPWNEILVSIAYYFYGVNTINFVDKKQKQIDMLLQKGLKTVDEMFINTHKNLVVLRKGLNYYPVYLLNVNIFKSTGIIDTRLFLNESGLITTIQAVVRQHLEGTEYEKIKKHIDLSIIKRFVSKQPNTSIVAYFINYNNLCYAVNIKHLNKICYIPIHVSNYSIDKNVTIIYQPFNDKYATDITSSQKLYTAYNKWVDNVSKLADLGNVSIYPKIDIEEWIVIKSTKIAVGFVARGFHYYIKHIPEKTALKHCNVGIRYVLYNPTSINKLIFKIKTGENKNKYSTEINTTLQKSNYHYYMYELVILRFTNIFNKEKNKKIRKQLVEVLAKTNFNKNMSNLHTFIGTIPNVEDQNKIKKIIGRFINNHHSKRKMVDDIKDSYFEFDRITLENLKLMNHKNITKELHKMAKSFVKIGDIKSIKNTFPNILTACTNNSNQESLAYCENNKLIMKREQLDKIIEIIASDIINPSKWKWIFNSSFIEKNVDYFKFIRRSSENIKVAFL